MSASATNMHNKKSGITLIEVMLSIVILGIGTSVLMLATARCLSVLVKVDHYNTAQRLIKRVSYLHPISRNQIESGTISGDFEEKGYHWEREIIAPENENRKGLYTVRTRVSWSSRGKEQFEQSFSYIFEKNE